MFLSNILDYISIVDIVLVIVMLITIIVGYKKGFMKSVLSLFGFFVILIFSFMFASQLASIMIENNTFGISGNINSTIVGNINNKMLEFGEDATVQTVLEQGLGIISPFSWLIANMIGVASASDLITATADGLTRVCMNVIGFAIIFIGSFIILLILKLFANGLRNSKFIRFVDGLLGIVLATVIVMAVVLGLFALMKAFMDQEWFSGAKAWLTSDMKLDSDTFSISKFIYNNNFIVNLVSMFIPAK